jgi:hypothetical protein
MEMRASICVLANKPEEETAFEHQMPIRMVGEHLLNVFQRNRTTSDGITSVLSGYAETERQPRLSLG